MTDEWQPTSGKTWRSPRLEGVVIPLPSGNMARIRPVALDMMVASGKIPDLLAPIAAKTLWTEIDTDEIGDVKELATGMVNLFNVVCKAAFVEPRVVDEPQADDEITLEDIAFQDKATVFQLAIGPARHLELFRQEQGERLAALHDIKGNGPAAE